MRLFASALTSWLDQHKDISLRTLEDASGVDNSLLSLVRRDKRPITLENLIKLIPAIEKASSRQEALSLIIAHLLDQTPPDYLADLLIEAKDAETGETSKDELSAMAEDWEGIARRNPRFRSVWAGLNAFMNHPEKLRAQDTDGDEPANIEQLKHEPEGADVQRAAARAAKQLKGSGSPKGPSEISGEAV